MDYHEQLEMSFETSDPAEPDTRTDQPLVERPPVERVLSPGSPRMGDAQAYVVVPGRSLPPPETLAQMLSRLEATSEPGRRHTEMKSALRRMGDALRKPLYQVPTDPHILRKLIGQVTPASAEMTAERWSRIRSLTLACMRDMGCDMQPGRDTAGHSSDWKALAALLPTKAQKFALSRFMSFCTRLGIEAPQVSVDTFQQFESALQSRSLNANPQAICRATVKAWNLACANLPDWPQLEVSLERHPHYYSFEWAAFPASLVKDVEGFLKHESEQDEFSEDYAKAMRPATIALRRRQLRQLASQLVLSGVAIEDVTDLGVLTRYEHVKAALQNRMKRDDGKIGTSSGQIAFLTSTIARRWLRDADNADRLKALAGRLGGPKQKGMTARNRERLSQFNHRENLDALMLLPGRVYRQIASSKGGAAQNARRAMMALAVEILTVAPMRVSNLVGLDLDKHLLVTGRGKGQTRRIYIPGEETKTGEPFEVILEASTAAMLDRFIKIYRPHLEIERSTYLFPSRHKGPRSTIGFSHSVSKFIKSETGLIMHVHLFRQLSGRLHLDANPTDFETVRKFLGHHSISTTMRHYVEHKTADAFARYDSTVADLRAKASQRTGEVK